MRHASHLALSNPSRCAPRRGFQTRYGFKRDYYAVKSHYVSACPANPQSRHRQDYYAVKSHFVPTIAPRVALPKPSRRAPRRGFQARYGFQSRLLRAEISSRGGAAARVHVLSPMSSPCARRAGDVAPYHGRHGAWTWCALFMMVGADVPGGPRTRCRPRCRPRVRGAPGTSRPTMGAMVRVHGAGMACAWCVDMVCMVHDGRGRRPRRPASPMSSPMSSPCARRAKDVAPYHGCHGACAWCVDMVCMVHDGRGRRPRRPAYTMSSPMSSPCARRAGDVAPYHGRVNFERQSSCLLALRVDRSEDADFAAVESRGESPGRFPGGPEISPPLGAGREIGISRPENRDKGGAVWVCGSVRPSRVLPRRRGVCII